MSYCLGWRIDWTGRKIIEPGMLYLKASQKNADVYLEGIFQKKTDMFFGSILMENLMPKPYQVEIRKQGYHAWKKILGVNKRQVTEAKNVVLIPENPTLTEISKNIENMLLTPDNKKIITKEAVDFEDPKTKKTVKKWALKSIDVKTNLKNHLFSQDDLDPKADLAGIEFSQNSENAIIKTKIGETFRYFIFDFETQKGIPLKFEKYPEKILFNPFDGKGLLLLTLPEKIIKDKKTFLDIREMNIETGKISEPLINNIVSADISNNNVYILDSAGFVFKTAPSLANMEKINIIPVKIKDDADYKLTVLREAVLLEENEALNILDEKIMSFKKISDSVQGFKLSPDSKQLLYYGNNNISILFLENKIDQPHKEAGENVLLNNFPENIKNAFWFTNFYVVLNNKNKVKIMETDDRSELNMVDIFEKENPEIIWADNNLYILSGQTLSVSTNLLP
ncbi:MAG: hypothetical protein Q8N88_01390 [Nanoarchaeota archaeon]|nr:hypothetical protein [Nanoarchaeota archaeon]